MSDLAYVGRDLYVAIFWLFAAILWWFFFIEERSYRIDTLRQQLFVLRSQLFFAAKDGGYLDAKAHRLARTVLNGFIRFAHELSFVRVLMVYVTETYYVKGDSPGKRFARALEEAIGKLPPAARDEVMRILVMAHYRMFLHIVRTSILIAPIYYLGIPVLRVFSAVASVKDYILCGPTTKRGWAAIDAAAYSIGSAAERRPAYSTKPGLKPQH